MLLLVLSKLLQTRLSGVQNLSEGEGIVCCVWVIVN
jgi:hypothetical protein